MMDSKQNLSVQKEIYRSLHEKSGIDIAFYKLDGTVISYSHVVAKNMGGKPEDFKGKSIYDLFPKQQAAIYHGRIKEAAASVHSLVFEDKILLPIGEAWFLRTFTKIEDDQGALIGIQIISTDITETKKIEELKLKQNLAISKLNQAAIEFLKLPTEVNAAALITKKIKEISGAEVAMFSEYDSVEKTTSLLHIDINPGLLDKVVGLLGKQIKSMKTPVSDEIFSEMISQRIGTRKTLSEISFGVISRPIGSAIQAILNVNRFIGLAYVLEGKLYGTTVLGMSKDSKDPSQEILENFISMASLSMQRKHAEDALKEKNLQLELAMKTANMAWWEMDITTGLVTFEKRKAEMLGYAPENFKHYKDFVALLHPEDYEKAMNAMRKHIDGSLERYEVEYRIMNSTGEYKWFYDIGTIAKRDSNGNPLNVCGLVLNITDRKLAENEILKLNEELEQRVIDRTAKLEASNKELEAFSYSVSHDLRAPLRAIDGYSQMLIEKYHAKLDEEAIRFLNVIRGSTHKMDHLISSLLEMAKVTRYAMKKENIEMNIVIKSVISDLQDIIDKSKISIILDPLPTAIGNSVLIRQVWTNLIDNAIKFTKSKEIKEIEIKGSIDNQQVVYQIADTGIGFNPSYSNKLFKPFYTLHSLKEFPENTGMGLALVERIIQRHGGKVWAEGIEGVGATFYFSLPTKD